MMTRALCAIVGLLGISLPFAAQGSETDSALNFYQTDILSTIDSSVLIRGLPLLTLLDGHRLPISTALGRMGTTSGETLTFAYLSPAVARKASATQTTDGKDSPREVDVSSVKHIYYGGEIGAFYGTSTGKYGGSDFGSYIEGTVGNDKVQITAGASYEESNMRFPRGFRR